MLLQTQDSTSTGNWLTVADAAVKLFQRTNADDLMLQADRTRVRRWLRSGRLRGTKSGRIWLVDVDDPLINKQGNDDDVRDNRID